MFIRDYINIVRKRVIQKHLIENFFEGEKMKLYMTINNECKLTKEKIILIGFLFVYVVSFALFVSKISNLEIQDVLETPCTCVCVMVFVIFFFFDRYL